MVLVRVPLMPSKATYLNICRPLNDVGERLTPEALLTFGTSNWFARPCCLCPHRSQAICYAQCDIHIDEDGEYLGEYVATCAS